MFSFLIAAAVLASRRSRFRGGDVAAKYEFITLIDTIRCSFSSKALNTIPNHSHQLCSNTADFGCFGIRCRCSIVVGTLNIVSLGSVTFFGRLTVPVKSRNAAKARPCISLVCTHTMLMLPWDGTARHESIVPCTLFRDLLLQACGNPRLP